MRLIGISGGSAALAVNFYQPAVQAIEKFYTEILEVDMFDSVIVEKDVSRFTEVVWMALQDDMVEV